VSKPSGPDLRLAILAGDETTVARVEGRMKLGAGWVSTLLQRLVVELWSDPAVAERIAHASGEYERRRVTLVDMLRARGVPARGRSGVNVWVPVSNETFAVTRVRDAGFAVAPGALHRLASPPAVRVSVGQLRAGMYEPLVEALAGAVHPAERVRQPV
jgi:DNA-binding transcriptional MocR family regulator